MPPRKKIPEALAPPPRRRGRSRKSSGPRAEALAEGGRLEDAGVDEACRAHDRSIDLRIARSLRQGALDGDVRSQALYFGRARALILGAGQGDASGPDALLPPGVAEAMIRAGLEALGHPPGEPDTPGPGPSPPPSSSRPPAPRSRQSARRRGAAAP